MSNHGSSIFEKFNSLKKPGKTARHVRLPSFGGINFQGKKFTYNGEPVVHVKGNSGSGKTSMLMALTGIKDQENFEVFDENGRPAVGLTGGVYLFQKSVLFQGSVEDNLLLPKVLQGIWPRNYWFVLNCAEKTRHHYS